MLRRSGGEFGFRFALRTLGQNCLAQQVPNLGGNLLLQHQHQQQQQHQHSCQRTIPLHTATQARSRGAMASRNFAQGLSRAVDTFASRPSTQCTRAAQRSLQRPASRYISSTAARPAEIETETHEVQEPFTAAKPFDFASKKRKNKDNDDDAGDSILRTLRVVPASPSYFSAKPTFTDDFLSLSALLRKVATLPTIPNANAPKVAWKTVDQYRIMTNEPVKTQRFHKMLHILRRLNCIHPQLIPQEVVDAMKRYKKPSQPGDVEPTPGVIDELGRAKGVGRRKTSSAVAWLVEGEGEALINGQSLADYFGRLHHRESAVWALKATNRLDKYNLFGLTNGGGTTGQAEAMTLAVAKALLVHEPALKPALRRGKSNICQPLYPSIPHVLMPCRCYLYARDPYPRGLYVLH